MDFPRTMVGGVSLPRMIIGCNWISGFSHTGAAGDNMIRKAHQDPASTAAIFETFLNQGIDAVLGLFNVDPNLKKAVEMAAVHGVVLGFETMETEFMNTCEKSMKRSRRSKNAPPTEQPSACPCTPA